MDKNMAHNPTLVSSLVDPNLGKNGANLITDVLTVPAGLLFRTWCGLLSQTKVTITFVPCDAEAASSYVQSLCANGKTV